MHVRVLQARWCDYNYIRLCPSPQYHVTDEGGSVLVRTIPVDGVGVVKMLSSDNGEYIYTMSPNTVSP